MKTRFLNTFMPLAVLFAAPLVHAQLTWDANGTTTGQTDGAGAWLIPDRWWDGAANQTWVADSNAIIGNAGTGGAITVGTVSAGTVLLNSFTGTYTLQGTGTTLTQSGGITIGAIAGNVTFRGTAATTGLLTISGVGGITKNSSGILILRENLVMNYTGATVVNSGVVMLGGSKAAGNFSLNGGMLTDYYRATTAFTGGLGTGDNQIQITGDSGFGGGNGNSTWRIGASGSSLVWGAFELNVATGHFNPTSLKFLTSADNMGPINYGQVTLDNGLNLNGAARTVQVLAASGTNALTTSWGKISGVISGSSGSLIKTGGGNLLLTAANIYGGGTTINQGNVRFSSLSAMPSAGNVTVNTGAFLTVEAGGAGDWTGGTSGVGTLGGLFSGLGSAGTSTVSFSGDATLGLEMTGNITYAADIPNLGDNLSIIKTGGSTLTLSGSNSFSGRLWVHTGTLSYNSIANVGAGNSALGAPATAANGTISMGSDGASVTLAYTGSGHSSDRVIHLVAASGTSTLDASGTGPLTLTSSLTAATGAKTLALTGTNAAANTLGATSIPGLAEVLTIQKNGAGTWRINGFSSPKNAWSITAGTLVAAGGITTGDQNVTVSGGTLAGVGPVILQSSKSLTVGATGSLSPGMDAVGTLAVTGILNISAMANGSGKLNLEMGPPAASDKISVTGTAQIGTGLLGLNDFVFTDLGGMTDSTYTLISTTGGITGSLDPANVSGTMGSITGALRINGNNLEFVIDSDSDGIPDAWLIQYFGHPTGLESDLSRAGDDADNDGSTNLTEYQRGTLPNDSDTDDDGYLDGVETNTGTWVSASNTGTNPLVLDTDGDTIRDSYETNTAIFTNTTNTGTNPHKRDSDSDSLNDNVETGAGTHVSRTNSGTNPNLPDTDNDGAGDWYEVAIIDKNPALGALPNSPNDSALKPNIPYPLPDPDASAGATNKPVKVYIMSGQSNMVGIGYVAGGAGSLDTIAKNEGKFPHLVNGSNAYTTRNDVRYRGVVTAIGNAQLTAGQGANTGQMGPELGFGHVMGYYHDEPVLLLKSSEGNRSLSWDILPPGSPSYVHSDLYTYAGYGQSPDRWLTSGGAPSPAIWYAGRQYDDFFKAESDFGPGAWTAGIPYVASGALGSQVTHNGQAYICKLAHTSNAATEPGIGPQWNVYWNVYSITNVVDVLDDFAAQYPQWATQGFEIAGFVWWQGHKDQGQPAATRYQSGMVNLINSLRSYYGNRYDNDANALTKVKPNAPFVLGTIGFGGWTLAGDGLMVANAQLAVSNPANNVKTIETRSFWRETTESPGTQGFHYNNNAETYMLTGEALGRAMVDLQVASSGNTYASWIAGYPSVPVGLSGFSQDADGDGVENGAENFFGTNPGLGSAGLVSGASSGNTFTFTHPQNASPATGVAATYRWSKDLVTFRDHGATDGDNTTVIFSPPVTNAGITTVTATVTGTPAAKLFVDVKVTQN